MLANWSVGLSCVRQFNFGGWYVQMWELNHKEDWVSKNWCFQIVVLEKTPDSLGLQGDQTNQSYRKSTLNIYWMDWCWSWGSNTLATWWEEPIHWKRPWCSEKLKVEGDNRGWDDWMLSLAQWIWIWANSRKQWRREAWHAAVHDIAEWGKTEWLTDEQKTNNFVMSTNAGYLKWIWN